MNTMGNCACAVMLALFASTSFARKPEVPEWSPPTEGMDYGAYPADYEAIVKAWFEDNLKDPYSAMYKRISVPRQEHMIVKIDERIAAYGYSVCADVNAKNSYGAYGGAERTWFLIRNGKIERASKFPIIYRGRPINCEDGVAPIKEGDS